MDGSTFCTVVLMTVCLISFSDNYFLSLYLAVVCQPEFILGMLISVNLFWHFLSLLCNFYEAK